MATSARRLRTSVFASVVGGSVVYTVWYIERELTGQNVRSYDGQGLWVIGQSSVLAAWSAYHVFALFLGHLVYRFRPIRARSALRSLVLGAGMGVCIIYFDLLLVVVLVSPIVGVVLHTRREPIVAEESVVPTETEAMFGTRSLTSGDSRARPELVFETGH